MKIFFIVFLGLLPAMASAVPERSVYPNSGPTDARKDENTDIRTSSQPAQEEQEEPEETEGIKNSRPQKAKDDFLKGPYDQDGNYRYVPEVRE